MGKQTLDDLEFKLVVTQTTPGKEKPLSVTTITVEYPEMPNLMANLANSGMTLAIIKGMAEKSDKFAFGKAKVSGDPDALKLVNDFMQMMQPTADESSDADKPSPGLMR